MYAAVRVVIVRITLASFLTFLSLSWPPSLRQAAARAYVAPPPSLELEPGVRLLAPIQYRALAIFPVVTSQAPAAGGRYLTLADGLRRKLVTVTERDGGGDVNNVRIGNRSDRPLLLLGGEVILGGQQDRILGKDTIVPPGERMSVEVFCVEHGRWSGHREFDATAGIAENKTRLRAKYRSNQQEVWDQVARKTNALGAESDTGTYRKLAAGAAGDRAISSYRDHLNGSLARLGQSAQMVGLVAAIDGRVTSVDIFTSPGLFSAYRDRLLDSMYLTAADVPDSGAGTAAPSLADVKAFIARAEAARAQPVVSGRSSRSYQRKAKGVVNSTLEWRAAPSAAPEAVYRSYQADE